MRHRTKYAIGTILVCASATGCSQSEEVGLSASDKTAIECFARSEAVAQLGGTGAIRALDQNEISLTVSLSDLARKAAGLKIDDDKRELARAYLGDQWFARFTEIQEALAAEDRIDRLDNIEAALLACEIDQD